MGKCESCKEIIEDDWLYRLKTYRDEVKICYKCHVAINYYKTAYQNVSLGCVECKENVLTDKDVFKDTLQVCNKCMKKRTDELKELKEHRYNTVTIHALCGEEMIYMTEYETGREFWVCNKCGEVCEVKNG